MDRHSAAFHAYHLTFRGAFRVSQAKLPDSIHYTRFCGTWREGAVAWSGQRSVGPSIGSFGVERVRECLSPESAKGPLRVAFPAKIHEFYFPQLFLDLPVEPAGRAA